MSGYCLECGNDLCICSELEEEAKKQPDVVFICQRKEIEKLQEQNKILREALELISETDISSSAPDLLWLNRWRNNTKERAREVLTKVKE